MELYLILLVVGLCVTACLAKMVEAGFRPLALIRALSHRPLIEVLFVLFFAVCFVQRGATKGTNGLNRLIRAQQNTVSEVEEAPQSAFRFTEFSVSSNAVRFVAALPDEIPWQKIDLFATHDVDTNRWEYVKHYHIPAGSTNLEDVISISAFSAYSPADRLFLRLGTRVDSDGDGLSDARERLLWGTSPFLDDTDGDGLNDRHEVLAELNPLSVDTDQDGYTDGEEALFGTNSLEPTAGALQTIRYVYDRDERLIFVGSGTNGVFTASELSPAGNQNRTRTR